MTISSSSSSSKQRTPWKQILSAPYQYFMSESLILSQNVRLTDLEGLGFESLGKQDFTSSAYYEDLTY